MEYVYPVIVTFVSLGATHNKYFQYLLIFLFISKVRIYVIIYEYQIAI